MSLMQIELDMASSVIRDSSSQSALTIGPLRGNHYENHSLRSLNFEAILWHCPSKSLGKKDVFKE